jgi:hypothetical protein
MGNYRCHFPCAVNNTAQHRMSCALTLTITIEPGATCCSVIETVNGYNIPSTMSGADENTDLSTLFSCKLFNMTRSRAEGSGRNTTSIRLASGLGHQVRLLGCACGNKQPCGESSATCGIVTRVCSSRKPSPCQGRQMAGQQERSPQTYLDSHLLTTLTLPLHILAVVLPPSTGLTPHIGCPCRVGCRFVLPSSPHPRLLV